MKHKILKGVSVAHDKEEGYVKAVISTFNVKDRDGDVLLPGSIPNNYPVKMASWGHKWEQLAIGKGVITVNDEEATFEGKFFLDTEAGREAYTTVKNLDDLQEWSWGFSIPEGGAFTKRSEDGSVTTYITDTEPYEVSPVLVGANPKTGTVSIKGLEEKVEEMTESVEEKTVGEVIETKGVIETKAASSDEVEAIISSIRGLLAKAATDSNHSSYELEYILYAMQFIEMFKYYTLMTEEVKANTTETDVTIKMNELLKNFLSKFSELGVKVYLIEDTESSEEIEQAYATEGDTVLAGLTRFVDRTNSLAELRSRQGKTLNQTNKDRVAALIELAESAKETMKSLVEEKVEESEEQVEETSTQQKTFSHRDARLDLMKRRANLI